MDEEVASKLQKSKEANAAAMKVLSESVDQAIAESKEATGDVSKSLETVKTQVDCLNKGDIIKVLSAPRGAVGAVLAGTCRV